MEAEGNRWVSNSGYPNPFIVRTTSGAVSQQLSQVVTRSHRFAQFSRTRLNTVWLHARSSRSAHVFYFNGYDIRHLEKVG